MRSLALVGFFFGLCVRGAFAAVPGDFDGDGVSDRVAVTEESDNSLTWSVTLSNSNQTSTLGSLGRAGDLTAMAQWLESGTQIGVVTEDESTGTLVWSIRNESGAQIDKVFGKSGDLAVAGGDFDGNGIADAAVVRLVNGKARWQISYDLFTSAAPREEELTFGVLGDRVFFARIEDGSADWIGVVRKGRGSRSAARVKNLVTGQVRQFSRLPKFASRGSRPRPFPIRQDGAPDLLGFQSVSGENTRILGYTLLGAKVLQRDMVGTGDVVVGNYLAGVGFDVIFQGDAEAVAIEPTTGDLFTMTAVAGTPVDLISLGVVGTSESSSGSGTDSSSGASGSISQCSQIVSWPSSHIYKIIGSEHFFDVRRNTIGIVVKVGGRGPFPSCVQATDTSGNVVAQLGLYARGAGWAARYYAGVGCGASTPLNGAAVASKARSNTGSPNVYMNFDGICYGPINAGVCIGSKQC